MNINRSDLQMVSWLNKQIRTKMAKMDKLQDQIIAFRELLELLGRNAPAPAGKDASSTEG